MFKGAFVAIVTPFTNGKVDHDHLRQLVEYQIGLGIDGIVACGSTGEAFFLSPQEQFQVIQTVVETTKKRVPVIAGTSAIHTNETLALVDQAETLDIDGLMIVSPPYVKPSENALFDYFKTVHDHAKTPIMLYDNPSRASIGLSNDVVIKLSKLSRIVSLKDATGILNRPTDLLSSLPSRFTLLSGEDATAPAYLAQGGHGVVSVTANVAPNLVASQYKAWSDGDVNRLAELRVKLNPLHKAMFCEPSPAPAKYALSLFGLCSPAVRPPLQSLTKPSEKIVLAAIQSAGIEGRIQNSLSNPLQHNLKHGGL